MVIMVVIVVAIPVLIVRTIRRLTMAFVRVNNELFSCFNNQIMATIKNVSKTRFAESAVNVIHCVFGM